MTQTRMQFADQNPRFQRWREFHRSNPGVFHLFRRFALQAFGCGRKIGARAIGERIRWEVAIVTRGEPYKVNDHFWPFYARLLSLTDKRFAEFFSFKNLVDAPTDQQIIDADRKPDNAAGDRLRRGPGEMEAHKDEPRSVQNAFLFQGQPAAMNRPSGAPLGRPS